MKRIALFVLLLALLAGVVMLTWVTRRLDRWRVAGSPPPPAAQTDVPVPVRAPEVRGRNRAPAVPTARAGPAANEPPVPGAGPAKVLSGDRLENEYVLAFFSISDRDRFMAVARQSGARILGLLDVGNMVRIRVRDRSHFEDLLRDGPTPLELSPNHRATIPVPPGQLPKAQNPGGYVAFGPRALDWLGLDMSVPARGDGVTVAVLDTGVARDAGLPEANLTRVSLATDQADDPLGHGTAVTSLLLGREPDLVGLVPGADILSIQVLGADGSGDAFTVARGIVDAVNRGADVISLSLGTRGDNLALRQAIDYASAQGVVVVAATGNDAVAQVSYPARYDAVIAVGAVDANGSHLYFSNRGEETDVAAPGLGVTIARPGNTRAGFSGTSAAVPFVSGAAALLLAADPGLGVDSVAGLLAEYSNDEGEPGPDAEYGDGVLDLDRLQNRDTEGIFDAGVSNPYLVASDNSDDITVVISAQNRGTETLPAVRLTIDLVGQQTVKDFSDVRVGQTVSCRILIDRRAPGVADGVPLAYSVSTPGVTDSRSSNNTRRTVVIPIAGQSQETE